MLSPHSHVEYKADLALVLGKECGGKVCVAKPGRGQGLTRGVALHPPAASARSYKVVALHPPSCSYCCFSRTCCSSRCCSCKVLQRGTAFPLLLPHCHHIHTLRPTTKCRSVHLTKISASECSRSIQMRSNVHPLFWCNFTSVYFLPHCTEF